MLFGPVDEEDPLRGSGDGGVEPAEVVGREEFWSHVALVNEHVGPLSALRFVAGDGIGVFHLQGVIVGVSPQGFEFVLLGG